MSTLTLTLILSPNSSTVRSVSQRYVFAPVEAVLYGHDALDALADELDRLPAQRVLVITSPSVRRLPVFTLVDEMIGDRRAEVFSDSVPHLPLEMADELIAVGRAVQPDAVVTLGGGTVNDAGKAVVAALALGAQRAEELRRLRFVVTDRSIEGSLGDDVAVRVPQIAIPTALSAAEYCGAFSMTDRGVKDGYTNMRLTPRVVMLDPRAVRDTPEWLWASTAMRSMDHAVESYLSRNPTAPTDATSAHAARLLFEHLPTSVARPDDDDARLQCLVAGWLSMFGFHNAGVGLSHAIGHQIGARWNVPHGMTSCVTLPTVTRFLAHRIPARVATLARACGLASPTDDDHAAAASLPTAIEDLRDALPVPRRLRDLEIPEDELPALAATVVEHTTARFAPFDVTADDVSSIVREIQ